MYIGIGIDMFLSGKVFYRGIIERALDDFKNDNGSKSLYERLFILNIVLATIRSKLNVLDDLFDVASEYKSSLESSLCEEEEAKRQELLGKAKRIVDDQRSLIGNVDDYASLEKKGRDIRLFILNGLKMCQIDLSQEQIYCQLASDAANLWLLSCKVECISLGKRDSLKSLSIVQSLVERAFLSNDINEVRRILIALYSLNFRLQLQSHGELNLDEIYIYKLNRYTSNPEFIPKEEIMSLLWSFNQRLSKLLPTLTRDPKSKNEFCRILQAFSSLLVEDIYPNSYQYNFSRLSFVTNLLIESLKLLIEDSSKMCNLVWILAKVNQILYSGLSGEDIALGPRSVATNALSNQAEIPQDINIISRLRDVFNLRKR